MSTTDIPSGKVGQEASERHYEAVHGHGHSQLVQSLAELKLKRGEEAVMDEEEEEGGSQLARSETMRSVEENDDDEVPIPSSRQVDAGRYEVYERE